MALPPLLRTCAGQPRHGPTSTPATTPIRTSSSLRLRPTSIKSRKNLIATSRHREDLIARIAWCLIGRGQRPHRDGPVPPVLRYEDFVQGYRPTDAGGFELKDGVFLRFCKRARAKPETRHLFIIDEINRGNLSRIFGELSC